MGMYYRVETMYLLGPLSTYFQKGEATDFGGNSDSVDHPSHEVIRLVHLNGYKPYQPRLSKKTMLEVSSTNSLQSKREYCKSCFTITEKSSFIIIVDISATTILKTLLVEDGLQVANV